MKNYEKPTLQIVNLCVRENIATDPVGTYSYITDGDDTIGLTTYALYGSG